MFSNIKRQYRHFQRYQQIAQILLRNGLGFIIDRLDLKKYLPFKERFNIEDEPAEGSIPVRIREVFQELGPTYIKLGQLLSTRADILSPAYIKELRKLQDKLPHVSFSNMETVLIEELGDNYQDCFKEIDVQPRATASIAQTHHAVLKDGTDVILKIQLPEIKNKIMTDLEILQNLARLAEERNIFFEFMDPTLIVKEFREHITKEMDFGREVANMEKFRGNFRENTHIKIPEVYRKFSTNRIIVMEEIKGIELNQLTEDNFSEIDNSMLAEVGAKAFMKQIFIDGFFHADPHPGNIFVVGSDRLAYIDFGIVGNLTEEIRDKLSLLYFAALRKKIDMIVDIIMDIGFIPGDINKRRFKLDLQDLYNRYYGIELGELNFMTVLDDFHRIIYKYHIKMPQEFFLLSRAIAVSEGLGYMLDPSFNIVNTGNEFLRDLIVDKIKPDRIFGSITDKIWQIRQSSRGLPGKLSGIINKVIDDELTVNFKHKNLENLINRLDIISNRLSLSLIISSLIIGSTMILQTDMQPRIFNIPLLGFAGYSIAGILGFILVITILRSGRF